MILKALPKRVLNYIASVLRRVRQVLDLRDLLTLAGCAALAGGLWGYDWRLALVVVGSLVLIIANWQSIRGLIRNGPPQ